MQDETISEAPILILGNKIDKDGAAGEDEIRHFFGLQGQTTGKVRLRSGYLYFLQAIQHIGFNENLETIIVSIALWRRMFRSVT